MRPPRFRIAWAMGAVALVALDLGAARIILDPDKNMHAFLVCLTSLPMVHILAAALLLASLRPRSRPYLQGFLLFGVVASAFSLVVAVLAPEMLALYLLPVLVVNRHVLGSFRYPLSFYSACRLLVGMGFAAAWATWPQVAFALVGGHLFRKSAEAR